MNIDVDIDVDIVGIPRIPRMTLFRYEQMFSEMVLRYPDSVYLSKLGLYSIYIITPEYRCRYEQDT